MIFHFPVDFICIPKPPRPYSTAMKVINVIIVACIMLFLLFKVVGPKLVSERSDAAVVVGVGIIFVGLYYGAKTIYNYLKEEA